MSIVTPSRTFRSILAQKRHARIDPQSPPKKIRNVVRTGPDRVAPPSEIAQGKVRTINERNAKALRAALDDAVRQVADRFGLAGRVGGGHVDEHGFAYQIALGLPNDPSRAEPDSV